MSQYRQITIPEDLNTKLIEEMRAEYFRGMNIEEPAKQDLEIAYSDLTVWYYNHDCQRALPVIKELWDRLEINRLGTNSLYFLSRTSFFHVLAETLQQEHSKYMEKLKIAQHIVKKI
jgi:hypothetical protein